jgi:hypothetical protein
VSELFRAFYEKQQAKANCKAAPAAPRDYKKLPNRWVLRGLLMHAGDARRGRNTAEEQFNGW